MGLGKTLTMIALIASDVHGPAFDDPSALHGILGDQSCGVTLVIVPPAREYLFFVNVGTEFVC